MLLEKACNIGGADKFFEEKTSYYRQSVFQEAKLLCDECDDWTYDNYQKRHTRCKEILRKFFEGEYEPK
jgi:hypothetical protein